ncbi:MAG: cation diffusion facilitator family transporter [Deltaproteobacteria bacterium]|nr:cation diffusion facilitator family transporter [Deltaproteobacteria bacterium]MBW1960276.1 cation diffusion facilitator family transporter [Deltaproteobacteria bacterium]MBW2150311.1 cation diffusion facilitator family transporter [Deltaproteobacteria bacterium]
MENLEFNQPASKRPTTADNELKRARKRAAVSILLNLLLSVAKGIFGVIGSSTAMIGDAIHSATDMIGSAAAFFGLWLAEKKHPSFPYGLYKAETLATLITSVAIILAGYEIGRRAVLGPHPLPDVSLTLPVACISLVITLIFGFFQLRAGRKLHSRALEADARDYLADGLSTTVVVLGLVGTYFGLHLDRWAAGAVALFVFFSGGKLLWRAGCDLLDEAIDRETEREIIALVEAHPRVERVERCLSRTAGGRFIVDLDVVFRTHSLEVAHRVGHLLEEAIISKFPRVAMVGIRTHSHAPEQIHRMVPVKAPEGELEPHMPSAPWFILETVDRKSGKILDREYIQNPHCKAKIKKGFLVGQWLLGFKPDQVIVGQEKESTATALLREAGVELLPAP